MTEAQRREQLAQTRREQRNKLLAEAHTDPTCPTSPDEQVGADRETAIWARQLVAHINHGRGDHSYVHEYTCQRCGGKVTIAS